MKIRILLSLLFALIFSSVMSQAPNAFKYQAVIRDTSGIPMSEKAISLRISIIKGDIYGDEVYAEHHNVLSDKLGLVNLNIGQGLDASSEFSDIPWGEDSFYVKIEIAMDGGMDYHLLGISQLMSVPYALYAENSKDSYWKNVSEGIITYPGKIGVGDLSYIDHQYSISAAKSLRLGSGNWSTLDFNGTGNDSQTEWRLNAHNNGNFQLRHWNGNDWNDNYLRILPGGNFLFGASGPKLIYNFRGFLEVTDSLKAGGSNFNIDSRGYLNLNGDGTPDRMIIAKNNSHTRIAGITARNNKYYRPQFEGLRARGSLDEPQDLQTGDCIMSLMALPYYNGEFRQAASIEFYAGENIGVNSYPAYMTFQTSKPNDSVRRERMRITENGKVGIGTTDPQHYRFKVETTANNGAERAIALFRNTSNSSSSLCNLYISSGDIGATCLSFVSATYTHWGGRYKMHTLLQNGGKGLVFRTGYNDEGRFAFEFRRELGTTYTYDEKVSITYEGNMGIGTTTPGRKLHINDVMRLEPRLTPPENPSEGDIYMDGTDHVLKVYDGTEWKSCW